MILVDTSAWVEFLRDTGSPVCTEVDRLISARVATCDVVTMEVLAGARDDHHLAQLRGLLARATPFSVLPMDYDHAAALYRGCRRRGATVPKLVDCLIAAVAIREDLPVLHADGDFDVLARHTTMKVHELGA